MAIAPQILDQISDRLDIVAFISEYLILKPRGSNWWGCCPFHQEKTPSFSVNPDKKMFYCFGCHAGGSIFKFLMEIEKLSFVESARQLGKRVGLEIERQSPADIEAFKQSQSLKELYRRVAISYQHLLWEIDSSEHARQYLVQRSISKATAQNYALGYAPSDPTWLHRMLTKKGYSAEFLEKSGLFSMRYPQHALFVDRLICPITQHDGQIIAYSGRQLTERGPKYINSPKTLIYQKRRSLFGLKQAWPSLTSSRHFFLCEGNFDVLALAEVGFNATVAPLGTSFTLEQARLLQRSVDTGVLILDGDEAGYRALFKTVAIFEQVGITPLVVALAAGEDPAQLLAEHGKDFLSAKINSPVDFTQFFIQFIEEHYDISRLADTQAAVQLLCPIVQASNSSLRKDVYLKNMANLFGVSQQTLLEEFEQHSVDVQPYPHKKNIQINLKDEDCLNHELDLILTLASKPSLFPLWQDRIEQLGLSDVAAFFLYNLLLEVEDDWPALLRRVERYDHQLAAKLVYRSTTVKVDEELLKRKYMICQRCSLLWQRQQIGEQLTHLDRSPQENWASTVELLQEQERLNKSISTLTIEHNQMLLSEVRLEEKEVTA